MSRKEKAWLVSRVERLKEDPSRGSCIMTGEIDLMTLDKFV